jgi:hypothetical protein
MVENRGLREIGWPHAAPDFWVLNLSPYLSLMCWPAVGAAQENPHD